MFKNDELKILNFHKDKYKNKIIFKKNIQIPKNLSNLFKKSIILQNKDFLFLINGHQFQHKVEVK